MAGRIATELGHGVPLGADISAGSMMKHVQDRYPTRRDELLHILAVDPLWRMHKVT